MNKKSLKNLKAIIFDLGGVVTPIEPWDGWTPSIEERSQIKNTISEIAKSFQQKLIKNRFSPVDFKNEFRKRTALSETITKRIINSICLADNDILNLIAELSQKYDIYGLVNAPFGWTELRRGVLSLDKYFRRIFSSYEIEARKPDIKIYNYLLKNTGLKPDECIFVDDKEKNIETAKNLGMNAYRFDTATGLKNYINQIL